MNITAFAKGLFDLVGARNQGQGISQMADAASPVIDLTQMLLNDRLELINASFGALVGGWNLAYTVQPGETLVLFGGQVQMTTGAGASASMYLMATPPNNPNNARLVLSDIATIAASQVRFAVLKHAGVWYPAGTQFGLYATDLVGAPTAQVSLYAARLRA